jgi:hypothetical protein
MSTTAAAQPVLTIVKDEFTKVLTEGTISPSTKPTDWNVVITEKSLLEAMKALSPFSKKTRNGLLHYTIPPFPLWKITANSLSTVSSCGVTLRNINSLTIFMLVIKTTLAPSRNYRNKLWHY